MRGILAWLMIFGIFAGVMGRAHPSVSSFSRVCDASECREPGMECDGGHGDEDSSCCGEGSSSRDSHEDKEDGCPDHPHHHHLCCGMNLVIVEPESAAAEFVVMEGGRLQLSWEQCVLPEGPFFDLDTPPLI